MIPTSPASPVETAPETAALALAMAGLAMMPVRLQAQSIIRDSERAFADMDRKYREGLEAVAMLAAKEGR